MVYEIKNGGEFIAAVNQVEESLDKKLLGERFDNMRVLFGNVTKGCPCNRKKRRRHFEEAYRAFVLSLTPEEKENLLVFFREEERSIRLMSDSMILLNLK